MQVMRAMLLVVAMVGCKGKEQPAEKAKPVDVERVERESVEAENARQKAEEATHEATKEVEAAESVVDELARQAADLDARVNAAVDAVADAQNEADREAAKAKLQALQKERGELTISIEKAKAAAARNERMKGVKIAPQCLDNPLAKGCN